MMAWIHAHSEILAGCAMLACVLVLIAALNYWTRNMPDDPDDPWGQM